MEYYISIIEDSNGWNMITDNLLNEIVNNIKMYSLTFVENDIKEIIYTIKNNLTYKNINLLKEDKELIFNDSEKFNKLINKINYKVKKIYNIPIDINDFINYKEGYFTVIKYNYKYEIK